MIKFDFWKKKRKDNDDRPWGKGYQAYPDTTRPSMFEGEDDWDVTTSRPVFSRPEGRTYEDFLRARMNSQGQAGGSFGGSGYSGYGGGYGRRYFDDVEEEPEGLSAHRMMQVLGAVALVGLLYFTFQSNAPFAQKTQAFVKSAMVEDTNVQAIAAWFQERVPTNAAVPATSDAVTSPTDTGTTDGAVAFVLPVDGTVKVPFDGKDQQGVTFQTAPGAEVKAVGKGMVEKIEKEGAEDFTITINHGASAGKTIYRHLVTVAVAENDWVQPNQAVGMLAKKGESAELFFAYQQENTFVDPADILEMPAGQ